jgi:hypothetical protein
MLALLATILLAADPPNPAAAWTPNDKEFVVLSPNTPLLAEGDRS